MDAIIYAAGRANRLGPIVASSHKILLQFGGKSLLERHAMLLAQVGVRRLTVVTGHSREQVAAPLPDLGQRYGLEVQEIFNPDYTEGSVISAFVSLPVIRDATGPVLVLDGDVLYDIRVLQRLVGSPHRSAMVIDRNYSTVDDDPLLVPVRTGRPFEMLKKWQGEADFVAESIGFYKIAPVDLPAFIHETEVRVVPERRQESLDEVLRAMVKDGLFHAEDISGLPWTEIDFPHDLEYASRHVLPVLEDMQPVRTRRSPHVC
jgi:choline kinase